MTPEGFAEKLHRALPHALRSVILYGSAAAGDFVKGTSHYDVLVVTNQLGITELNALSPPVQAWESAGNRPPQVLTSLELAAAADTFPLEILDMQQSHRVLWGDDPLATIRVQPSHLRLQLERELKGKLLLLRQRYLVVSGNRERLAGLMVNSVTTFLVLMRGALRLYQEAVPTTKAEALDALARHIPFDPQPFHTVLNLKERTLRPREVDIPALFPSYLTAVERVVSAIDQHIHQPTSQEITS